MGGLPFEAMSKPLVEVVCLLGEEAPPRSREEREERSLETSSSWRSGWVGRWVGGWVGG